MACRGLYFESINGNPVPVLVRLYLTLAKMGS